MNAYKRDLFRPAREIQRQLRKLNDHLIDGVRSMIPELLDFTERMKAAQRKLTACATRGWKAAETKVLQNMEGILHEFPYYVQKIVPSVSRKFV